MPRCIARLLLSLVVGLLACVSDSQIARAAPPPEVEVLIRFKNAPGPNDHALIRGQGGTVDHTFSLVPAVAARIPPAAVAALQKNPNVAAVEPDVTLQINDVELDRVWGVTRIGATATKTIIDDFRARKAGTPTAAPAAAATEGGY